MPESFAHRAPSADPEFRAGQDVRLASALARDAAHDRRAVTGTVTGVERQEDETFAYTVHFPGKAGTRHGLTGDMLEETQSPAIRPWNGIGPFSVKEAEELLLSDQPVTAADSHDGPALLGELAGVCQLEYHELATQLAAKPRQREQEQAGNRQAHPAALAANDIPRPLLSSGVTAEFVPAGHEAATPAQGPRRGGPRR